MGREDTTQGKEVSLTQDLKVAQLSKAGTRFLRVAQLSGKSLTALSASLTVVDVIATGSLKGHHVADIVIGVSSAVYLSTPVGWGVTATYLIFDMGIKSYTGKTITEHIFD